MFLVKNGDLLHFHSLLQLRPSIFKGALRLLDCSPVLVALKHHAGGVHHLHATAGLCS